MQDLVHVENCYIAVRLESILSGTTPDFNIYVMVNENRHTLYREGDTLFTENDVERLIKNGKECVYILKKDASRYALYLENNLRKMLGDPSVSIERKTENLYETSSHVMKDIFEHPEDEKNVERGKSIVDNTVSFLLSDERAFKNLFSIRSYDYCTYTHSVHVSNLLISLAKKIKLEDSLLRDVGVGGLFHDIGKSRIPKNILNKRGRLSVEEFKLMKQHVLRGAVILENSCVMTNEISKSAILEHHEKCNGSGYPYGISKEKISIVGRIASIVDIYDALSTNRPYKESFNPFSCLKLMKLEMKDELDSEILTEFIMMLHKQSII